MRVLDEGDRPHLQHRRADHGNCSVGSLTHGFKTLDEVAGNSDVAVVLESGWMTMEDVPQIPVWPSGRAQSPTGRWPRPRSILTSCSSG